MSSFVSPANAGTVSTFAELGLCEPLLKAVAKEGYDIPTPIQLQAVPYVLQGRDLLGCAQTGTGKTAAFALPILHHLMQNPSKSSPRPIRALVLTPTRELAVQIHESFKTYGHFCSVWHTVIFGGVGQNPQVRALKNGVDVVIATPGRLLDLMNQGFVDLRQVEHLVLDEADNMLDMGFIHDIRKIISRLPNKRQTLLFSATMPSDIRKLADAILHQPISVAVTPVATTVDKVVQSVQFVERALKPGALVHYLNANGVERALVFTRTKHGADRVVKALLHSGMRAQAIHGNKSQNARQRALAAFKGDAPPILVATDIAARGLDIDEVSHVINYEIPNVPETYVHRIGRTARAGAAGIAVSFCDQDERAYLRDIQRLIRQTIPVAATPQTLAVAGTVAARHHPLPERNPGDRTPMRPHPPRMHPPQFHAPRATLAGYGALDNQAASRPISRPAQPKHAAQHTGRQHDNSGRQANGAKHPAQASHPNANRPPVHANQPQGTAHQHKVGGGVRREGRPVHPLMQGQSEQGGHRYGGGFGGQKSSGGNNQGGRRQRRR